MESLSRRAHKGFKPYPAYRDSGVEWLGEIPAHWKASKMWRISSAISGGTPTKEESRYWGGEIPWVSPKDMKRRFIESSEDTITEQALGETGLKLVSPPAVLIVVRGMILAHSFPVAVTRVPVTINQDMKALRLRSDIEPLFIAWLFEGVGKVLAAAVVEEAAHGTCAIRMDQWRSVTVPVPPVAEQRAIAAFLDRETATIDVLVAKKERLIELLHEERTALITRAVTKGLAPMVRMKDSGVEWLGRIPAHWEVRPLKHIADFINGFAFKPDEWSLEGTPIIRIENLNGGDNFNCTTRILPARYCAYKGDLLFGWSGNRGTSFGPFVWWREGKHYVNQHIFRLVDYDVDKMWLYWVLRGVTFYVEKQAHGIIGMVHVTRGELGTIPIPVLPLSEQAEIARSLEREHARIDSIAKRVQQAIDRLKELRSALISAAVTGKIDLREEFA